MECTVTMFDLKIICDSFTCWGLYVFTGFEKGGHIWITQHHVRRTKEGTSSTGSGIGVKGFWHRCHRTIDASVTLRAFFPSHVFNHFPAKQFVRLSGSPHKNARSQRKFKQDVR